jgi:hypothetical protein
MSSSLRTRLGELVSTFAAGIVDAVRGASLEEISGEGPRAVALPKARERPAGEREARERTPREERPVAARTRPTHSAPSARSASARPSRAERLPRRSLTEIAAVVDQIVALLTEHREGLRAEQIRDALGVSAAELPRPLKEGLAARRLVKSGEKRATTYTVRAPRSSTAPRAAAKKKRAAKRPLAAAAPPVPVVATPAATRDPTSDEPTEAREGSAPSTPDPAPQEP